MVEIEFEEISTFWMIEFHDDAVRSFSDASDLSSWSAQLSTVQSSARS